MCCQRSGSLQKSFRTADRVRHNQLPPYLLLLMSFRTPSAVVELLEARIAPASVISYMDLDGDEVTVKSSHGDLNGRTTFFVGEGGGKQLQELNLTDDSFSGAKITFSVKRGAQGDGLANVGFINAADNDLAKVVVKGDLGRIVVGDSNNGTPAIKSLVVRSMGAIGISTQTSDVEPTPPPSPEVKTLLDQLIGTGGLVPGLLEQVGDAVHQVLGDDALLHDLSSDVVRSLHSLGANLDALNLIHDGTTEETGSGAYTSLLGNILEHVSDLSILPNTVGALPGLLDAVKTDLTTVVSSLKLPLLGQLDLGNLVGKSLSNLLNLNLDLGTTVNAVGDTLSDVLGGIFGGLFGGQTGGSGGSTGNGSTSSNTVSVGALLQTLGLEVNTLINLDAAEVPALLTDLLGQVKLDLSELTPSSGHLSSGLVNTLSDLQCNLSALLICAKTHDGLMTDVVKTVSEKVCTLLETLLGGGGRSESSEIQASVHSIFRGDVKSFKVKTDVRDVFLNIQGNLTKGVIKGSLIGDDVINGGSVLVTGNVGKLNISKNLIGGDFANTGSITVNGKTGTLALGGSVVGDDGHGSGSMTFDGDVKNLRVRGSIVGGDGIGSASVMNMNGDIRNMLVGGTIVVGDGADSGSIRISDAVKNLKVKGSIVGDSDHRASISIAGLESVVNNANVAIGKMTVGGTVRFADILAGYDARLNDVNGDAQIGKVAVKLDWVASNLSAGIAPQSGEIKDFGEVTNRVIAGHRSDIVSKISSIVIKGSVFGTHGGDDNYGFVAEQIGTVKIASHKVALSSGGWNDVHDLSESTHDVCIREANATSNND